MKRVLIEARAAYRITRVFVHLFAGVGLVSVVFPVLGQQRRAKLRQRWARQLLAIFNIRLEHHGENTVRGGLLVANHISWLDVYGIMALEPASFVSKAEVRSWPLVGWLATRTGTIFLHRGSRGQIKTINVEISRVLGAGGNVTVFPEGTTTDGTCMLAFHTALLQPAITAGHPVQPLALRYHSRNGEPSTVAAYAGDTTMWQSLCNVARNPELILRIDVIPALPSAGSDRRTLGTQARLAIAHELGHPE
jgi:1-acyl-sn-glycerol-3-phosphate acyltransferase